uniref:Uncharacterized protein n=1 Tax=Cyanothece sp. (strain PCC 7425 / ATCC 29141) TaxID=395961 RepID=B8HYH6_CYAP4
MDILTGFNASQRFEIYKRLHPFGNDDQGWESDPIAGRVHQIDELSKAEQLKIYQKIYEQLQKDSQDKRREIEDYQKSILDDPDQQKRMLSAALFGSSGPLITADQQKELDRLNLEAKLLSEKISHFYFTFYLAEEASEKEEIEQALEKKLKPLLDGYNKGVIALRDQLDKLKKTAIDLKIATSAIDRPPRPIKLVHRSLYSSGED